MKERLKANIVIYLVLLRENNGTKEVLLQKRQNTGWMDDFYDLGASGHVEEGESLLDATLRESFEELGIRIKKEDLEFKTFCHTCAEKYINFAFATDKYEGTPEIMEKDKCSELKWFPIDELPKEIIPKSRLVLENIFNGKFYQDIK